MKDERQDKVLTAVIIDDEAGAINVLTKLLERIGGVRVLSVAQNPNLGLRDIVVLQPDIVFLDIQMEKKSGIDLLQEARQLLVQSHFVITSGYDNYTFEAFKEGAFDYLIKPISISVLEKTIFRIASERDDKSTLAPVQKAESDSQAACRIRISNAVGYILAHEILYLKASGSYTEIYHNGCEKEICTRGLWLLERELPDHFFRIHRSTVVNLHFVKALDVVSQVCTVSQGDCSCDLTISKASIAFLEQYMHENSLS